MKVTVKDYLNVRVGKPSVNAPTYQYLSPGSVIETDGRLYKGDTYEGVDIWVRDLAGNYYWSGGIDVKSSEATDITHWTTFFGLNILATQFETQMAQAPITILDTGVSVENSDLSDTVGSFRNFLFPNKNVSDFDGHGTYCAGIIAANGRSRIVGGASGVRLNVGKILTSSQAGLTGLTETVMIAALDWAAKISDVISVSAGLPTCTDALKDKVQELVERKKIIVAAIGNIGETNSGNYPAMLNGCISVGALNNSFDISNITVRENTIDICVPGENIVSTLPKDLGFYGSKTGTSVSTPLVASIIYFMKLRDRSLTVEDTRKKLLAISDIKKLNQFEYRAIKPQPITL